MKKGALCQDTSVHSVTEYDGLTSRVLLRCREQAIGESPVRYLIASVGALGDLVRRQLQNGLGTLHNWKAQCALPRGDASHRSHP